MEKIRKEGRKSKEGNKGTNDEREVGRKRSKGG